MAGTQIGIQNSHIYKYVIKLKVFVQNSVGTLLKYDLQVDRFGVMILSDLVNHLFEISFSPV